MALDRKRFCKITSVILIIFIILFTSLAYFHYLDLKKTLVEKISVRTTSFIGQKVDIGDISFSDTAGISLHDIIIKNHDIIIKNPEGFDSGQLLKIKRLYLKMKLSELFKGRFYFKNIAVYSPELTVMKDRDGRFNISVSSEDFTLSAFREFFDRYKVDTERTKINMSFNVEGDTERGINLKSWIQIKNTGFAFFKKDLIDIRLDTNAFYNIHDSSVTINNISLNAGDVSAVRLKGVIKEIQKNPFYSAEVKIDRLDLSAFNFIKNLKASGIMTSDNIRVKGKFDKTMPEISGSVQLRDASVNVMAENVDLGIISQAASKFSKIPYSISGDIKNAAFEGTIDSVDSLHGNASLQARKISILKIDNERNILKDVFLNTELKFEGKDFEFKADAGAGNILLRFSGLVKEFLKKERAAKIKATLPEVKVTAIRDSLWDIFPDKLLYAGLDGYISGKVDGIANLKGSGTGISQLIGKADLWTYSTGNEKTKISREFLQKIGGPSLKTYLGDRRFDKGIMRLYLQDGFVIFKELEISNRNLIGITDLSVKVAPFNNRIALDYLMWTITEAAQRVEEK